MIIGIAFLLLAALLLWVVIGSHGHWAIKLGLILLTPILMFLIWNGLKTYEGWPTTQSPPRAIYFLYGRKRTAGLTGFNGE